MPKRTNSYNKITFILTSDSQTMCRGTKLCREDIENVPKISTQQWLYLIFSSFGLVKKK
jgi:hypothetical protein